jgi:hypothetical protein
MPNSPRNPFDGARQRLARAKTHIKDLKRSLDAFVDRDPYRHIVHKDPDGIHEIHKLSAKRRSLPVSFGNIATDAIENMRAALDLAVYPIGVQCNSPDLDKVCFPFCGNERDWAGRAGSACRGFREEIITLLKGFEPYKGGNDLLWALNEFTRISKHKRITTAAFQFRIIRAHWYPGFTPTIPLKWDRTKNEVILGSAKQGAHVKYKFSGAFNVCLNDIEVVANKPVTGLLNRMAGMVESIITGLEAESSRIGLFS